MTQQLTAEQEKMFQELQKNSYGVYRKFMTKGEIKTAESLVRIGFAYKSKPAEKNATIAYFSCRKY